MENVMEQQRKFLHDCKFRFIGMDIDDLRKELGYWWILESQSNSKDGFSYTFWRGGWCAHLNVQTKIVHRYNRVKNVVISAQCSGGAFRFLN